MFFEELFLGLYSIWRPPYPMKSLIFLKAYIFDNLLILKPLEVYSKYNL